MNPIIPISELLDDCALREHTPAQADDLYELISDRAVNHLPLILLTATGITDLSGDRLR